MIHPTAILNHNPDIGEGVQIGEYTVVHGSMVTIGDYADIGEGCSINASDSHLKCIGLGDNVESPYGNNVEYLPIEIGAHVYIGARSIILGGCTIGHHSVIGAGVFLAKKSYIPPFSLVLNPTYSNFHHAMKREGAIIKWEYYRDRLSNPK